MSTNRPTTTSLSNNPNTSNHRGLANLSALNQMMSLHMNNKNDNNNNNTTENSSSNNNLAAALSALPQSQDLDLVNKQLQLYLLTSSLAAQQQQQHQRSSSASSSSTSSDLLNLFMNPNLLKAYQQYQLIASTQAHLINTLNSNTHHQQSTNHPLLFDTTSYNNLPFAAAAAVAADPNAYLRNLLLLKSKTSLYYI